MATPNKRVAMFGVRAPTHEQKKLLWKAGYGSLYIIGFEDDADDAPVKVGYADEPFKRLYGLQTGNWQKIRAHEILYVRGVMVHKAEAAAHDALDEQGLRVRGEWFSGGAPRVVELVRDAVRGVPGSDVLSLRSAHRMFASLEEEVALQLRPPRRVNGPAINYRPDPKRVAILTGRSLLDRSIQGEY